MIGAVGKTPPAMRANSRLRSAELEKIRKKINNEEYIHEAIQRIALILSNGLLELSRGGVYHEQRKGGK